MLTETGRVVAVEKDGLWVETIRRSTCGSCAAQKGCGHGLLNRIADGRRNYVRVLAPGPAIAACAVDDRVRISIPDQVILRGSVVVYVLPLLSMLSLAAGASVLWPTGQDLAAAGGAVTGLLLGFGLVRWHAWRHRDDSKLQPTLLEVVSPAPVGVRWD
jgi:sigma-E factor negative regulatory protein RseC